MHGNRDGGVGYSPNICQLFLAYLLDCLAILGTVCVHAGKRGQTDAIYSQLYINFTKGTLRGVFLINHSGFHSGPWLGLHICGFKRPVKEIFFNVQRQGWVVKLKTINISFSYTHFLRRYFLWWEGPKGKVYLKSILGWSAFFSFQETF